MSSRIGLITSLVTCWVALATLSPLTTHNPTLSIITSRTEATNVYTDRAGKQTAMENYTAAGGHLSMPTTTLPSQPSEDRVIPDRERRLAVVGPAQIPAAMHPKRSILVAVLDTGIDKTHEALSGLVIDDANFSSSYDEKDRNGHGTYIAGIIAAKDNPFGIVGVAAGCHLLNVKVADDEGRCEPSALAKGIAWAVDHGADVINVSIELHRSSPDLEKAVDYAWDKGSLIVAASGNDAGESSVYPARYDSCVAVCCLEGYDKVFSLSNCEDWVRVAAPGLDIYSCLPKNRYGCKSGTSCAAAYASGIAALIFTSAEDTDGDGRLNDEVKAQLEAGYRQITAPAAQI